MQKQHLFLDLFLDGLGDDFGILLRMVLGGKIGKNSYKSIPKRRKCDPKTKREKKRRKGAPKGPNINPPAADNGAIKCPPLPRTPSP